MADTKRALLVYAWDGRSPPLNLVTIDAEPAFDLLLFDYSGTAKPPPGMALLSVKTQCKGEIYRAVHRWLAQAPDDYDYVGLLDDDIEATWSDMNRLLAIARAHGLDCFAAGLGHDSHYSHPRFLRRAGGGVRPVPWIEVMMPFYRKALFMAGGAYYARVISSWGLDQFVMTTLQKLTGHTRVAVIDDIAFHHRRPITSDTKTFANGLTAQQERDLLRRQAMAQVAAQRTDLVGTRWYFATFAPWDGPARYWRLRLAAPALWLRARFAVRRADAG
jgi:hypothetical protein